MHRFRVAGEYFDEDGEGVEIVAGSFPTLAMARRAVAAVKDYVEHPDAGKLPPDLEELAVVGGEVGIFSIALYVKMRDGTEEWLMSFDPDDGRPSEVTPDAETVWPLLKKALKA